MVLRTRWATARSWGRSALALATLSILATGAGWAKSPGGIPLEAPGAAAAAPNEDELLIQACRYLRLSRSQLRSLVPVARTTERARAQWEREEAAAQRELERLGESDPDTSAQLRKALDERRERQTADVVGFAGPQLVRILTREQIALAWRLNNGSPPKYMAAEAEPLLHSAAGFVNSGNGFRMRGLIQPRGGAPSDSGGIVLGGLELLHLGAGERERTSIPAAPSGGRPALRSMGESAATAKPFMQLVVETSDLRELLPALEPLSRRMFMSARCLPALARADREGLTVGLGSRSHLGALGPLRLVRDYRMERGFRDLAGRGPELEPLGGGIQNGVYQFDTGQGLKLENAGVTDHYALQLTFRHFGDEGYKKVLDFKQGAEDGGLYLYQGHLTFYTYANGGVPVAGQEHRLRLERNRNTRVVRAYLDLRPAFAFMDLDDAAVFSEGKSLLFVDDRSTKTEQGPGAMRSVSIWSASSGT